MKRLLLIIQLFIVPVISIGQTFSDYEEYAKISTGSISAVQKSLNPRSNDYIIYWNNVLNIQSYTVNTVNPWIIFTHDDQINMTETGLYYSIHPNYYKLYIPADSIVFLVKMPKNRNEVLANHLYYFMGIIDLWHTQHDYLLLKTQ